MLPEYPFYVLVEVFPEHRTHLKQKPSFEEVLHAELIIFQPSATGPGHIVKNRWGWCDPTHRFDFERGV